MYTNRLSRRVHVLDREPVVYRIGSLYFRLTSLSGARWYARVSGSARRLRWWMNHLHRHTAAYEVEVLHATRPAPARLACEGRRPS